MLRSLYEGMDISNFYMNYTPIGDIITLILCIVSFLLSGSTYTKKDRRLLILKMCRVLCVISAIGSISFYSMLQGKFPSTPVTIHLAQDVMYIAMAGILNICCIYLSELCKLEGINRARVHVLSWGMFALFSFIELMSQHLSVGLQYKDGVPHENFLSDPYIFMYIFYCCLMVIIIACNRRKFVTKMRRSLVMIVILTFVVVAREMLSKQNSYTCFTFYIPVLVAQFLFHFNSYDLDTGTLSKQSFSAYVQDMANNSFGIMYLNLVDLPKDADEKFSDYLYHFGEKFFKSPITFRISEKSIALCYSKKNNANEDERVEELLLSFNELYLQHGIDYKLIYIQDVPENMSGDNVSEFISFLDATMMWNSFHRVDEKDVERFSKNDIVLEALRDIAVKHDLEDERVKVFCQPVFNTKTGTYNTAEALMRIVLPEHGMIFPDVFIPIAEQNDFIHELTRIILYKTCREVEKLTNEGYLVDRVSVNVSTGELRMSGFCSEIIDIVEKSGAAFDKIAIEITESKNENDYDFAKDVMIKLKDKGIYFYLDDFGTGYSNMERLVNLPFDIIKFDRSMTILSGKNAESMYLVGTLSDIFRNSGYTILFEGVEDENDETRCMEMNSTYLQGYKYSKPIPIDDLRKFFTKVED